MLGMSASEQVLRMREALSRRPPPPVVNGVAPYLDVMTISSAQFPTTIDGAYPGRATCNWYAVADVTCVAGGKNQEEHTRLLMEPIAVPNLDHTGLTMNAQKKKQVPLFYPTGKKNCNFRDTIRGRVRYADAAVGSAGCSCGCSTCGCGCMYSVVLHVRGCAFMRTLAWLCH